MLESAPAPLIRGLGASMGAAIAAVHADHGVEVRCGVTIEGLQPGAVLIDGGWHEPADVVVVGIGVSHRPPIGSPTPDSRSATASCAVPT